GRQAELLAERADLVLEQAPQRLDQLELEVVREAADVVVRLDVGRAGAAARLDDVGVEGALDEELDRFSVRPGGARAGALDDLAGGLLEHPDELPADDRSEEHTSELQS